DRLRATQTKADTEFLARELASVSLSVGDMVTRDYLRRELDDLRDGVERIETLLAAGGEGGSNAGHTKSDPEAEWGGGTHAPRGALDSRGEFAAFRGGRGYTR